LGPKNVKYLIRKRTNLHVVIDALATKIVLSNINGQQTATAVEFSRNNKTETVRARKEIIVSGGVINSPQLLQLSGIGPRSVLQSAGIKTLVDLPVGENFRDHINFSPYVWHQNGHVATDIIGDFNPHMEVATTDNMYKYASEKRGPLAWAQAGSSFYATQYSTNPEWPDVQYFHYTSPGKNNTTEVGIAMDGVDLKVLVPFGSPQQV
jgi:choline dehydrogenase-like flavoprotein